MSRTTAKSPDLWGWDTETTTVETETLSARGATYTVSRVYVDGDAVGYVVGRPEGRTGKAWDYVVGDERSAVPNASSMARLVFGSPSRQHALVALVETAQGRAERYSR